MGSYDQWAETPLLACLWLSSRYDVTAVESSYSGKNNTFAPGWDLGTVASNFAVSYAADTRAGGLRLIISLSSRVQINTQMVLWCDRWRWVSCQ